MKKRAWSSWLQKQYGNQKENATQSESSQVVAAHCSVPQLHHHRVKQVHRSKAEQIRMMSRRTNHSSSKNWQANDDNRAVNGIANNAESRAQDVQDVAEPRLEFEPCVV